MDTLYLLLVRFRQSMVLIMRSGGMISTVLYCFETLDYLIFNTELEEPRKRRAHALTSQMEYCQRFFSSPS